MTTLGKKRQSCERSLESRMRRRAFLKFRLRKERRFIKKEFTLSLAKEVLSLGEEG